MKRFFSLAAIVLFSANIMYAQDAMIIEIGDLKPQFRNIKTNEVSVQQPINNYKVQNTEPVTAKDPRSIHEMVLANNLVKLTKGEPFNYPLKEGSVLECYAKRVDGSIDSFLEYNDYFYMKYDGLYSYTLHKLYKKDKANELKKINKVSFGKNYKTLKLYDMLREPNLRRHRRTIIIDMQTGEYYMNAFQDNATWYRKATATGYCRVR